MARGSLMEGIPEPASPKKAGAPGPSRRNLVMGCVAAVIFIAAGAIYYYNARGGSLPPAAAPDSPESKLRADLEAKNPPPPPPTEPVEEGGGHKVQR